MNLPYFLRQEGNSLIYKDEGEMIFFLPESYFTRNNAIIIGENINVIGMFNYVIYDKNGKQKGKLTPFYFPTSFLTQPYEVEIKKQVKLTKNSPVEDYRLLKFKKDSVVVVSTKVPQMIVNVEEFFSIFMGGNMINTIPYDKLHEYFIESMSLNGNKFGFNNQIFGIMIGESCRDIDNRSIPFRLSGKTDLNSYQMIGVTDIPKVISPYTAITSENWDDSTVAAVMNKKHKYSPLEKIMTV